jgi:tRNA U34 2-thiouridine synthase MnmA/TrmU
MKALGLLSGGLDSTLAARLLQEQGVDVEGVHFSTGFCKVDHRRALARPRDLENPRRVRNEALRAGSDLEAPVEIVDVAEEYLREVVLKPKHGYGSAMNPCVDCRIFMLKKAREMAGERGAELVFTGEVVGQRPMSQYRAALDRIEEESGLSGRLLRPLSARHLEPTEAERAGRIDRDRLERIHGRARRDQLALAKHFEIEEFPAPSGGCCYLADPNFARRLRDLVAHRGRDGVEVEDILFLKVGRHFRLGPELKLILGRDEPESRFLEQRSRERWTCRVADRHGALGRVEGSPDREGLEAIASLAARYSARRRERSVAVLLRKGDEEITLHVAPAEDRWARSKLV